MQSFEFDLVNSSSLPLRSVKFCMLLCVVKAELSRCLWCFVTSWFVISCR